MKVQPSILNYCHVYEPDALFNGPRTGFSAGQTPCQLANSS
ncbi:MAG TPA: hypothetical protein VMW80_05215 [Candidatus Dormibacteraeota bacterium]|nr:hypothetical protein [Candidatus Dormibacteraeota bacterium]